MPRVAKAIQLAVQDRAASVCEYCHFPEAFAEVRFVCDHIIARQHGGTTTLANLAWCCAFCNYHKGPNIYGIDPQTGNPASLFNPRTELWTDHFRWKQAMIIGLTPSGRATVATLQLNHPDQLDARAPLIAEGKI